MDPQTAEKQNIFLELITHLNGLRFENFYIYSRSLNQPKYKLLKELLDPINGVEYLPFSNHKSVIYPDEALPNSIMVFDDIACKKRESVRVYFYMGSHQNVDCCYLYQSYTKVPKHLIRDNISLLAIFRQNNVNSKHIHDDHVYADVL